MTLATDAQGNSFHLKSWDCPTCGKGEKRFVGFRGGEHHRYGLGLTSRIVRCSSCTLLFADPFPVPDESSEIYGDPDRYFENHEPAVHLSGHRGLVGEILRRSGSKSPRVLDIGSGRGELLRAAKEAGLDQAVGLELSAAMVHHAREHHDVTVLAETVEVHAHRVAGAEYDAFVLSAVLEHVHNPDSTIEAMHRMAKRGAIVYIDIPQEPHLMTHIGNVVGRISRRRTVFNLSPTFSPFHVYGFSQQALETLLTKHGCTIEDRTVWASPGVRSDGGLKDKVLAKGATQVNRLANLTGTASNQYIWARFTA